MQSNKIIFFAIIGIAIVLLAALFLARVLFVNSNPIAISVLYSTEKEAWLEEALADFEGDVGGRPIEISLEAMGSREIYLAVANEERQPVLISPASTLQISLLQEESTQKFGSPVVDVADPQQCRSVVETPLVLVAWQERAEALGWLDNVDQDMWEKLQAAVIDSAGWSAYNHPEWGFVKFGHTDPLKSNSGLMTVLLITYDYFDKTGGLTTEDIVGGEYDDWFSELGAYTEVGDSTGTFMEEIVAFGPSRYDLVAVYESTAIEQAPNAAGRYGALSVYYPPATIMSDHPFCVLDADWVDDDQAAAAQVFVDYLLSRPAQESALALGFRPADSSLSLTQVGSPFPGLAENGIRTDNLPPEVEVPPGNVLDTLLRFWERNSR